MWQCFTLGPEVAGTVIIQNLRAHSPANMVSCHWRLEFFINDVMNGGKDQTLSAVSKVLLVSRFTLWANTSGVMTIWYAASIWRTSRQVKLALWHSSISSLGLILVFHSPPRLCSSSAGENSSSYETLKTWFRFNEHDVNNVMLLCMSWHWLIHFTNYAWHSVLPLYISVSINLSLVLSFVRCFCGSFLGYSHILPNTAKVSWMPVTDPSA